LHGRHGRNLLVDGLPDNIVDIKGKGDVGIANKSSGSPKVATILMNLTNFTPQSDPVFLNLQHAISCKYDQGLLRKTDHLSSRDSLRQQANHHHRNQEEWRFMRFAPTGADAFKQDPGTGYSVLMLDSQDVDVSRDGLHWFHIGGPHCFAETIRRGTLPLLAFRGFPHDPQSVLAAVNGLALVGFKLCLNIGVWARKVGLELGVAPFAYADGRRALLYDPQFALLHDCSLAHQAGGA
jgi:hypothetical protein